MNVARRMIASTALLLIAAAALAQVHAHHTPPLTPDGPFPRMSAEELALSGYPDHHHAYTWPDWRPLVDAEGRSYGPGSLCSHMLWLEREDVLNEKGLLTVGRVRLSYNPSYKVCAVAPYVELTEQALREVSDLIGLASDDTLYLDNADTASIYTTRSGQGMWRMYQREGDTVLLQPIPILMTRTLASHAAYDMVVDWYLSENGCGELPAWFREGLKTYVAEMGVHLNNFMQQFRLKGGILLAPDEAEKLLQADPILDDELDRQYFRRARYMAFMMVWRLVEEHGGLAPVRAFLGDVASGKDPDAAARAAWGRSLAELVVDLDPNVLGEPIGDHTETRKPHLRPAPEAVGPVKDQE